MSAKRRVSQPEIHALDVVGERKVVNSSEYMSVSVLFSQSALDAASLCNKPCRHTVVAVD